MTLTNGTDIQALRSQEERGEQTKSCQCTPGIWDAGEHEVNEEQSKDRKTAASNRAERAAGCSPRIQEEQGCAEQLHGLGVRGG